MPRRALVVVASSLVVLLAQSCGSPAPSARAFPPDFMWGVATAAQESEGNNENSDWDAFAAMGNAPPAGMAQNSYALYDVDAANAASLGANMFQLTIEWARIVPRAPEDPTAPLGPQDVDAAEVRHYHDVLASLTKRGLRPVVTVTHFSLPTWVDNPRAYDENANAFTDGSLGGFTNEKTGQALARYAAFVASEFREVDTFLTMDEPIVALVAGYMVGNFPPGLSQIDMDAASLPNGASPKKVLSNMIAAHALAYHAIKGVRADAKVSFAHNSVAWDPLDDTSDEDRAAAERVHHAYNEVFLDALTSGDLDTSLVGTGPIVHHAEWASTLDFIGVNYYDRDYVVARKGFLPPLEAVPCAPAFKDAMPLLFSRYGCPSSGPPEEEGMTRILLAYDARYHLPQLVTESGFIDTPEGKARRLVRTLDALANAIDSGARVTGYTYWTLNYDYEWNDGWTQNMGIFTVQGFGDGTMPGGAPGPGTDFTRAPLQPMADVFTEIARGNALSSSLLLRFR